MVEWDNCEIYKSHTQLNFPKALFSFLIFNARLNYIKIAVTQLDKTLQQLLPDLQLLKFHSSQLKISLCQIYKITPSLVIKPVHFSTMCNPQKKFAVMEEVE